MTLDDFHLVGCYEHLNADRLPFPRWLCGSALRSFRSHAASSKRRRIVRWETFILRAISRLLCPARVKARSWLSSRSNLRAPSLTPLLLATASPALVRWLMRFFSS